jgi:hypothetical protein
MQEELVTVAKYPQAIAAEAAKICLESNGVRAFVADENFASTMWSNLAEVKLQVAAADADRAKKLLTERHDARDLTDDDE